MLAVKHVRGSMMYIDPNKVSVVIDVQNKANGSYDSSKANEIHFSAGAAYQTPEDAKTLVERINQYKSRDVVPQEEDTGGGDQPVAADSAGATAPVQDPPAPVEGSESVDVEKTLLAVAQSCVGSLLSEDGYYVLAQSLAEQEGVSASEMQAAAEEALAIARDSLDN